jgi:hypothetical protein
MDSSPLNQRAFFSFLTHANEYLKMHELRNCPATHFQPRRFTQILDLTYNFLAPI